MALGGGYWLFQNKTLPGAYINFVSKNKAFAEIVDRGYATMALSLDWGVSNKKSSKRIPLKSLVTTTLTKK